MFYPWLDKFEHEWKYVEGFFQQLLKFNKIVVLRMVIEAISNLEKKMYSLN
jgi:hypothetical protein